MIIRHAEPARDGAGCAAVYAPSVTDGVASFEEWPPDAAEMTRRIKWAARLYPWLVAEEAGELAGYAYATKHRDRAAYRWAADVSVYISPDYHRRGIGRALYAALLELLERQGVLVVCAGITLPNPASVGLHEACGFQPVGIYPRIGWKAGSWWDTGWWELELVPATEDPPPEPGPPARLDEPIEL